MTISFQSTYRVSSNRLDGVVRQHALAHRVDDGVESTGESVPQVLAAFLELQVELLLCDSAHSHKAVDEGLGNHEPGGSPLHENDVRIDLPGVPPRPGRIQES